MRNVKQTSRCDTQISWSNESLVKKHQLDISICMIIAGNLRFLWVFA